MCKDETNISKRKRFSIKKISRAKNDNANAMDEILEQHDKAQTEFSEYDSYSFILDTTTFSFSNLSSFDTCHYGWYLRYIQDEQPQNNVYAEFGSCCHNVLEKYLKGEIIQEDLANYYIDTFDDFVKDPDGEQISIITKLFNAGFEYFMNCNPTTLKLIGNKIVGVEHKCNFIIGDYKFIGVIDLLLQDETGELIIVDHKSGEYPLNKNGTTKTKCVDKLIEYKRQLYLYAKAVYDEFHKYPKVLAWNFFKTSDWLIIPFNEKEYQETLEWAVNTIDDMYLTVEFDANPSFFYCRNICSYRGICDKKYPKEELP